jgi:hypothetical protein
MGSLRRSVDRSIAQRPGPAVSPGWCALVPLRRNSGRGSARAPLVPAAASISSRPPLLLGVASQIIVPAAAEVSGWPTVVVPCLFVQSVTCSRSAQPVQNQTGVMYEELYAGASVDRPGLCFCEGCRCRSVRTARTKPGVKTSSDGRSLVETDRCNRCGQHNRKGAVQKAQDSLGTVTKQH